MIIAIFLAIPLDIVTLITGVYLVNSGNEFGGGLLLFYGAIITFGLFRLLTLTAER